MNKDEYLRKLKIRLSPYPDTFRRDIIHEFYNSFENGRKEGKTDKEIIEELGSVDEVIDNIRMMNGEPSRMSEDGTYQSAPRQNSRNTSVEDFLNQVTDSLDKSFDILFNTVENNLRKPTDKQAEYYSSLLKVSPDWTELDFKPAIVVTAEKSDISVHITKGNAFGFLFTPDTKLFTFKEADLQLYQSDTECGFAVSGGAGDLNITVPQPLQSLKISLTSGEVNLLAIEAASLAVKTKSGDLTVNSVSGGELNFFTNSGVFSGREIKAENIRILSDSGDIGIEGVEGTLTLKSSTGDILIAGHSGDSIYCSAASGDISVNSEAETISLTAGSGDITAQTSREAPNLSAETKSGDIDCRIRSGSFRLAARLGSGDIKNYSDCPLYQESSHEYAGGSGSGKVMLITKYGDITIR